jgi:hypothetical protein
MNTATNKKLNIPNGTRFGKWYVINELTGRKRRTFLCRCDCGMEREVSRSNLTSGKSTCCGSKADRSHGYVHGFHSSPIYDTWCHMINRCTNQNNESYADYGGRGITVCKEWINLKQFISDMEPSFRHGLYLDRRDNNAGYSKENCRWVTPSQSARNKRGNVIVLVNGTPYVQIDAAKMLGVWPSALRNRFKEENPCYIGGFRVERKGKL